MTTRNPTLRGFLSGKFSKQAVFDYVRKKVNEQGNPSVDNGNCVYRGENGCKCAAGHLVTDKDMAKVPHANGNGIFTLARFLDIPNYDTPNEGKLYFISSLQSAHDTAAYDIRTGSYRYGEKFLKEFNNIMNGVANDYNLKV